ncbi:hypothetical protein EVAR_18133_1 [Eumeta japonica]|uniref:Uncharacterized protein n=1 Tax=Eumeta variegata TaxID=151549 RepID=A0A4C1VHX7_EUMVA|nr:hypothetical protein EVAR_18133_1 [Eumeta japonica]
MGQGLELRAGQGLELRMGQGLELRAGQGLESRMGQGLELRMGQGLELRMGQELELRAGQGLELRAGRVEWIPVMTEMGICMTFNSEYATYQFLFNDVEMDQEPLLQCHYHSAQCYVRIDTFNNAVRYFIHSPYDIPSAISNPTGEVLPGEEMVIDFKVIEIEATPSVKKLRLDQRRCRYPDEWLSDAIRVKFESYRSAVVVPPSSHYRSSRAKYSLPQVKLVLTLVRFMKVTTRGSTGLQLRLVPDALQKPHGGDVLRLPAVFPHGVVCDAHGMACIGRNVEILINLPKNLAKCSCLPQCAELNYYSHTKKVVVW